MLGSLEKGFYEEKAKVVLVCLLIAFSLLYFFPALIANHDSHRK